MRTVVVVWTGIMLMRTEVLVTMVVVRTAGAVAAFASFLLGCRHA